MVIQSYNVTTSSQRTFMSMQATSMSVAGATQVLGATTTSQEEGASTVSSQTARRQNQNDQGQNVNNQGQNGQGQNVNNQGQNNEEVFKDALQKAKDERDETVNRMARGSPTSRSSRGVNHRLPRTPQELRASLAQLIYEMLTGRTSGRRPPPQIENANQWRNFGVFNLDAFFGVGSAERTQGFAGLQGAAGVQIERFEFESETITYQAQGVVKTADGRVINIDVNMHMSRQFVSYMNISTESTRLVDPLVINYGGTAASLMGEKFLFDLTMDGNLDSISLLGEGNGFLAIDKNGDRKINDGSQLFGPSTGCGFDELRKYDTDGNGWIDANDEIFDKLVVWRRDKDGNDIVYTLKELGIGAIFLGDISTEFSFKGDNNETLGVMRSTSFFLKNCGNAGTLSHVDLAL